jgi:hypothetical protein
MIELSVGVTWHPKLWDIRFGWTTHHLDDTRVFDRADVLNISLLFLKIRLWVFNLSDDE